MGGWSLGTREVPKPQDPETAAGLSKGATVAPAGAIPLLGFDKLLPTHVLWGLHLEWRASPMQTPHCPLRAPL